MLFVINSANKSYFSQLSCKYKQYIHRNCFIIMFAFSIWLSVSGWYMIKSHVSISRHVHSVFQNIKTNWLSQFDTIVLGNSCNLNTFFMKICLILLNLCMQKVIACKEIRSALTVIYFHVKMVWYFNWFHCESTLKQWIQTHYDSSWQTHKDVTYDFSQDSQHNRSCQCLHKKCIQAAWITQHNCIKSWKLICLDVLENTMYMSWN